MTVIAGSRETGLLVIGIRSLIICICMASKAGIRCVVIIPVVAGCTIIGDCGMCTIKCVIVIVDREAGGHPFRVCRMAQGAVIWNAQGDVVGIDAFIVIIAMTPHTGIWGILESPTVAGRTIIRDRDMRPGEWENLIMIKT